jgi:hypothetical protein
MRRRQFIAVASALAACSQIHDAEAFFKGSSITLPRLKAGLARQASGGAAARILPYGHSHIAGEGAGTGTLGLLNASPNSWVQLLPGKLAPKIIADCHSFYGDQNAPLGSVTFPQMDPRVLFGATGWVDDTATTTMGGRFITEVNGNTGFLDFTPGYSFTSAKFWYPITAGLSTNVGVYLDGVLNTSVNQAGANSIASLTISIHGGASKISLLNSGSAKGYCTGFECFRSSQQAVVGYAGWLGATVANVADNSSSTWAPRLAAEQFAPDLLIVQIMINNIIAGNTAASWQASLDALLASFASTSDIIIVIDPAGNNVNFTNGLYAQYITAAQALAATYNGLVVDMRQVLGSTWAIANAAGLMFDNFHVNATGQNLEAQLVAGAILNGLRL